MLSVIYNKCFIEKLFDGENMEIRKYGYGSIPYHNNLNASLHHHENILTYPNSNLISFQMNNYFIGITFISLTSTRIK